MEEVQHSLPVHLGVSGLMKTCKYFGQSFDDITFIEKAVMSPHELYIWMHQVIICVVHIPTTLTHHTWLDFDETVGFRSHFPPDLSSMMIL